MTDIKEHTVSIDEAQTLITTLYAMSLVGCTLIEMEQSLGFPVTRDDIAFFVNAFEAPLRMQQLAEQAHHQADQIVKSDATSVCDTHTGT